MEWDKYTIICFFGYAEMEAQLEKYFAEVRTAIVCGRAEIWTQAVSPGANMFNHYPVLPFKYEFECLALIKLYSKVWWDSARELYRMSLPQDDGTLRELRGLPNFHLQISYFYYLWVVWF
jgi:hypothetical protein